MVWYAKALIFRWWVMCQIKCWHWCVIFVENFVIINVFRKKTGKQSEHFLGKFCHLIKIYLNSWLEILQVIAVSVWPLIRCIKSSCSRTHNICVSYWINKAFQTFKEFCIICFRGCLLFSTVHILLLLIIKIIFKVPNQNEALQELKIFAKLHIYISATFINEIIWLKINWLALHELEISFDWLKVAWRPTFLKEKLAQYMSC